jgi:hypothetical protein
MAAGKTAYVNRKKVMGGATDFSATYNVFNAKFVRNGATCEVRYTNNGTKLLRNQIPCTVPVKDQDIADAIGLDASMIKKGEIILGITGTYEAAPRYTYPDDYEENQTAGPTTGNYVEPNSLNLKLFNGNNFSAEHPYLETFYGYNELSRVSSSKKDKYKEFYRRVFNCLVNNGALETYTVNGSNLSHNSIQDIQLSNGVRTWLAVYSGGLNLNKAEQVYIYSIVRSDCPALMARFPSEYAIGGDYLYFPFYTESTRQGYINECETTFKKICRQIHDTYGIVFMNKMFYTKNKAYSDNQKKKIAKVIHDYLEVKYEYGLEGGNVINQTMYPALETNPKPSGNSNGPVCAAYAAAFQYCCWRWGISCVNVTGGCGNARDGRHAWNMVCYAKYGPKDNEMYNGSLWQENDCTWDDLGGSVCGWAQFNVQTSEINRGIAYTYEDNVYIYNVPATPREKFLTSRNLENYGDGFPQPTQSNPKRMDVESYKTMPGDGTCTNYLYKHGNTRYYASTEAGAQIYGGFT